MMKKILLLLSAGLFVIGLWTSATIVQSADSARVVFYVA